VLCTVEPYAGDLAASSFFFIVCSHYLLTCHFLLILRDQLICSSSATFLVFPLFTDIISSVLLVTQSCATIWMSISHL
jgi:hypothetical protein